MDEIAPVPSLAPATLGHPWPSVAPVPSLAPATLGHPWPSPSFTALDHQFARFMVRQSGLTGIAADKFALLIKRLSASLAAGHSCLPLTSEEEQDLRGSGLVSADIAAPLPPSLAPAALGQVSEAKRRLRPWPSPLVLWHDRLYLQRYYRYELRLAEQLKALAQPQGTVPGRSRTIPGARDTGASMPCGRSCAVLGTRDTGASMPCDYQTELDACFGMRPETDAETDWQRQAAEMSLQRPLTLISGGPGTGKT
ncbi:MAG: hypothetical protein Q8R42_03500, partial [Desulfocapsaceae bacterium]|nr:hypothetical protein [Desulfocapsaceae bacterium]